MFEEIVVDEPGKAVHAAFFVHAQDEMGMPSLMDGLKRTFDQGGLQASVIPALERALALDDGAHQRADSAENKHKRSPTTEDGRRLSRGAAIDTDSHHASSGGGLLDVFWSFFQPFLGRPSPGGEAAANGPTDNNSNDVRQKGPLQALEVRVRGMNMEPSAAKLLNRKDGGVEVFEGTGIYPIGEDAGEGGSCWLPKIRR